MKCTRLTRRGLPCKAQALPATDPPACVAHASANGRHSTRDEDTTRRLLVHLRAAGRIGDSLAACGIPRRTFYDWLHDEAFARQVKEARRDGVLRLATLIQAAAAMDWRAAAWHLEQSDPEHWGAGVTRRS